MELAAAGLAAWVAARAAAMPPDLERMAEEAADRLYNLEFAQADETLRRMRETYPAHPAGPSLTAALRWWQARYWYRDPDAAATREMDVLLEEAIGKSRELLRDPATECEGRFFLGGTLGVQAHWQMLRHHWVGAAMGARDSVKILKALASCTEYAEEANFGLGLYEYAGSKLPTALRWLSRFIIGRPDRDGGLAKLELAAGRARWMRTDAQGTLALLYTVFDVNPGRGLLYASRYLAERPDSPMAHTMYLQALTVAQRFPEALATSERALTRGTDPASPFSHESTAFHYYKAMALMGMKRPREAVKSFTAATAIAGRPPWIIAAHLKRGGAKDILGDREGALADYRAAAKLADPWRLNRRAKPYFKRPFTWEDFDRELTSRPPE